jgi:hypothetical protein
VPAPTPSYIVPESFAVVYVGGRQYKVSKGINPPSAISNLFAQSQEFINSIGNLIVTINI